MAAADRRIQHDVVIEPGATRGAKPGQIVTAELVVQPGLTRCSPIGRVVEVLGDFGDPGMEIEIALRKHELPFEFSHGAKQLGVAPTERGAGRGPQGPLRIFRRVCRS